MPNPYLPPETLDCIVDNLHDESKALQICCLVAKSWLPRTRKHLFADVKFSSSKDLQSWKKTFPDPSTSPAYYTRTLLVGCPQDVTAADAEEDGWIRTFSCVARLEVDTGWDVNDWGVSLTPFHALSPVLKSLCVSSVHIPPLWVFGLARSLPHLEDLTLMTYGTAKDDDLDVYGPPTTIPPPSSPPFTGTLILFLPGGVGPTARRLLGLPNGLHFRTLSLPWFQEGDIVWINALVMECSHTLERLRVEYPSIGALTWLLRRNQHLTSVCRHLGAVFNPD